MNLPPRPVPARAPDGPVPPLYHWAIAAFKRQLVVRALRVHGGNRSQAARALGLNRTHLLKLIRDYGLKHGEPGRPGTMPTALQRVLANGDA